VYRNRSWFLSCEVAFIGTDGKQSDRSTPLMTGQRFPNLTIRPGRRRAVPRGLVLRYQPFYANIAVNRSLEMVKALAQLQFDLVDAAIVNSADTAGVR
jgi:hypothetical protein